MSENLPILLNCRQVKLTNTRQTLLKEFNVCFKESEWVEITGKNNSGKSSLLDMIYGLNHNFSGTIEFFDLLVLKQENFQEIRKKIGYISSSIQLISNKTLRANLSLALTAINSKQNLEDDEIQELLFTCKMKEKILENVDNFSASEIVFAKLVRALICKPKLLLLDCPFRVLDSASEQLFLTVLRKFWELERPTIILCTDHLSKLAPENRTIYAIDQQELKRHLF